MKILFVTNDLIAGNLAYLLTQEGHDVKLFVQEKDRRKNFDHMVKKTNNWKREVKWVGKDGLIVFDDAGYGKDQDRLRKKGYTVFGGCELGDKLENNREYGQKIFAECGMKTVMLKDFDNMDDAVMFVKKHKKAWVIKQNGHAAKTLNYVGVFSDGRDVISVLKNYLQNRSTNREKITLQKKVAGVEIGVGRYFNGNDWVGPMEMNIEYKKFFPGDIGTTTSEMGTLAWYDDNENNKLFKETLAKMKPYLKKINFKGDMEVNCIVNGNGAFPLEATPRFGSPIIHLHSEIHNSPWGELLYAIASGKPYNLKWKRGYGIVVLLALPPFPYTKNIKGNLSYGMSVHFKNIPKEKMKHIHFEEVSKRPAENVNGETSYYVSDNRGYVLYATGMGKTVEQASKNTYRLVEKIILPKTFYRNDIGESFKTDQKKLKKLGYL
ncbi:MAG: hypothetical protein HQ402_00430 [Parcubacteria group bacterium]|nr:hypothetical protein [Parcubacteria group bacterium]